jgi:predicted DNA-binding protein
MVRREGSKMAPRKKHGSAGNVREYKLRLPLDISARIEAKAKKEQRPQNRVIINELAAFPRLEKFEDFANLIGEMDNTLARYSARVVMHDLSDELLRALDTALAAQGSAQQAALDKLRVIRSAMFKTGKDKA